MENWSLDNWHPSRFGEDDVLGAFNLITPESILAAADGYLVVPEPATGLPAGEEVVVTLYR
jgi:hypothetical protein